MKVWLVSIADVESNEIKHICKTEELAIKRLFEERDKLIEGWKHQIKVFSDDKDYKEGLNKMIKNVSSDDYKHWDNYPQEVPYISEREVEE